MTFSEWIKSQIEALRAMVVPETAEPASSDPADGAVRESHTSDKLELKFHSNPANVSSVRKTIEQFCQDAGLDRPAADEIGLVVNEALANVIRHAYGGATNQPIEVKARKKDGGVSIEIRDWGNGVDPSQLAIAEKDPLEPGGLGLICLRKLLDGVEYLPQPDGMILKMNRKTPGSMAMMQDSH